MYCYDSPEYVKDMGTPDRYVEACKDFDKGIVESKNLQNKQKAIFWTGMELLTSMLDF